MWWGGCIQSKPFGNGCVLAQHRLGVGGALLGEAFGQLRVLDGEDLGCQQRGVCPIADTDAGHGDAGGHLDGTQ